VGVEIFTPTGTPNMVLDVRGDIVLVRTDRSPSGQPVGIGEVQKGLDLLTAHRSVRVSVEELGHRSAFVGAVLATLPGAQVTLNPAAVTLCTPNSEDMASDRDFPVLDGVGQVKVRREQTLLRKHLAAGRTVADCVLCGQEFPVEFLVAAHVKRRAVCSDDERRDLDNLAMLVCAFGCDALYEAGWITVDHYGHIQAAPLDGLPDAFRIRLVRLAGLQCAAHNQFSERYFSWHRTTIFRGSSSTDS
jgi:hypothetical protein